MIAASLRQAHGFVATCLIAEKMYFREVCRIDSHKNHSIPVRKAGPMAGGGFFAVLHTAVDFFAEQITFDFVETSKCP
jgi:hypothetical protein